MSFFYDGGGLSCLLGNTGTVFTGILQAETVFLSFRLLLRDFVDFPPGKSHSASPVSTLVPYLSVLRYSVSDKTVWELPRRAMAGAEVKFAAGLAPSHPDETSVSCRLYC
jgi:hypothetical protein